MRDLANSKTLANTAKWRVQKDTAGLFNWKVTSPDGRHWVRTTSRSLAIEKVQELIKRERQAMTMTLADITAEERADCVGMWADVARGARAVIVNAKEQDYCWVIYPEDGGYVATCRNEIVTPRFDLPRAWKPDGEPVPMKEDME